MGSKLSLELQLQQSEDTRKQVIQECKGFKDRVGELESVIKRLKHNESLMSGVKRDNDDMVE